MCDRSWTLQSPDGAVDVDVRAPDGGVLADVADALSSGLGLPEVRLWAGSVELPPQTPLSSPLLRNGAVLGLGHPGPRETSGAGSGALELHVVGGPDAGRTLPLGQGPLVLGRGAGCGLPLADPDVSRRHAVVSVAAGRVTVADLGSSNGTTLSGGAAPGTPVGPLAQEWPVGGVLRVGSSALRLTGPRGALLEQVPAAGGRRLLRPLGAPPRTPRTAVVRLPGPPVQGPRRRLGWVAVALPAVGGLLMAWLVSAPQFLFFALLGPLVAVAGWASDRVTGRRTHRRAVADHALARALADSQLDAAVCADLTDRDDDQPDPARLAAAARRRSSPLWSRSGDPGGLTVRLGTGTGPTGVVRVEPDGSTTAAVTEHVPVPLSLAATGSLGIVGPRGPALGIARSALCQLAVLTSPAQLGVVLACNRERVADWAWTTWLPHLQAVALPGDEVPARLLDAAGTTGAAPCTLVVLDGPVEPPVAEALARGADRLVTLDLADSEAALALPAAARLEVTGETGSSGRLRAPGLDEERALVLDAVSAATAAGIARDLAGLTVPASAGALPDSARLLDLPSTGLGLSVGDEVVGSWLRHRDRLLAVLGSTGPEPLGIDLVADGPHALVAGTTGSGKSELLQTLVASLALHHPPDRCSFLLVDYKGGAAFGEASTLPHTVGVLTDLDHQSTARALRSLSAELTRRERLLADHRARDLADLPDAVALSRLVIVVDEFATLAEELPGFVTGLVGIAQRGRSLGVHLVLATQRPAGVLSPEIRANTSLRICLRTTDEGDARDVLGSAVAAHLPADRPGRAYLRTGSASPVLFQVARVSGVQAASGTTVTARRRPWPPVPGVPPPPPADPAGAGDLTRLVGALDVRAGSAGLHPVDRPWLPPLPDRLAAADLDRWAAGARPTQLRIGLLDSPDAQLQAPLELDLAAAGGWLLVGGPRSGRTTVLRTVLGEAVHQLPPSRLHVHVLDHGGGALARDAAVLPHCGTAVGRDDAHRALRLLARLGAEVDRRRVDGPAPDQPLLLVLVDGHESLVAQLEEADPATGAAGLLRLVRDGAAVGVTVLLTADRAVPGSRLAGAVRSRLVLPLPDRTDYAVAGVPARAVPGSRPPGRALVGEDAVEGQVALPRMPWSVLSDAPDVGTATAPIRISVLPADPELELPAGDDDCPAGELWLPLGPGGDDGTPLGVDLHRAGGLLVVGPAGSGRSSALHAFARHCRAAGAAVAELGPGRGSGPAGEDPPSGGPVRLDRGDPEALRAWLAGQDGRRPAIVVVDDLGTLPEPVADLLTAPPAPAARLLVLAAGTAAELAGSFRGPAVALRRHRTALLLRPAAGDAELFGLRTPRSPLPPRPGAGWLVTPTAVTRVQVARRRRPAGPL
ncbi:FtsK/SpoIIIE domain-containing protein [Modestobacter excelsi]|uniref:FtsK/SpoIIIE domain-containing protein n=1 Tax=Modestobacter excelsi TaxID=2213161 RepID=UPI00110C98A7|nr:FtsK/SpoIIIE domain-containing protein [Modestobacter excelsi]